MGQRSGADLLQAVSLEEDAADEPQRVGEGQSSPMTRAQPGMPAKGT